MMVIGKVIVDGVCKDINGIIVIMMICNGVNFGVWIVEIGD